MSLAAPGSIDDEDALLAEVALSCFVAPEDDSLPELAPVLVAIASEVAASPPLGVLIDVATLLLSPVARLDNARRRLATDLPIDATLGRSVAAAFDSFIAPLASSAALGDVRDALLCHPADARQSGAALVVAEIASRRLSTRRGGAPRHLDAGAIRRILARPAGEIRTRAAAFLLSPSRRDALASRYGDLAGPSARHRELFTRGDLLLAENAPVLRTRAARTSLRQIAEASELLSRRVPRSMTLKRSRGDDVSSRAAHDGAYPMGGFSSMSNAGSLESVVSSELAYSTPSADLSEDLFTVRWALGELLYYTRDDNVALRRRTTVSIFFRADLAEARRKDQGAPYQRTTLALASIVVWIGRALQLLRGEAVHFRLWFDGALDVERGVLQLALIREIGSKLVTVEESSEAEVAVLEGEERKRSRLVSVRVGGRAGEAAASGSVYVAATAPPAVDRRSAVSLGIDGWAEVTSALLATL